MPQEPPLIAPKHQLAFYHQDSCSIKQHISAYQAYCLMTIDTSVLLKFSFRVRDIVSSFGGVKPIYGFSSTKLAAPPIRGEKIDFFTVKDIDQHQLCLTSIDSHLSVMFNLHTEANDTTESNVLIVTTSVITHSFFGRIYMLPVAPVHGVIVKKMLKKLTL